MGSTIHIYTAGLLTAGIKTKKTVLPYSLPEAPTPFAAAHCTIIWYIIDQCACTTDRGVHSTCPCSPHLSKYRGL